MPRKEIGYTIGSVASFYKLHPQTLRAYERQGLLRPSRSPGNTRLYTKEDLRRLQAILNLTRELGVNLAGVEVILNMREKMKRVQAAVQEMVNYLGNRFDVDPSLSRLRLGNTVVRVSPSPPVDVAKRNPRQ